jgi:hypothetical protein
VAEQGHIELEVKVETNIDRLSETAIRRFLGDTLTGTVEDAEEFLRFIVPKDTGEMEAHVGHHSADPEAGIMHAAVGIPRIEHTDGPMVSAAVKDMISPGEQDSGDYPLFRDRGTGIFGPLHAPIHARRVHVMRWEGVEGHPIFREEVAGSEGAHFMLATYAFAHISLIAHVHEMDERIKHLATSGDSI